MSRFRMVWTSLKPKEIFFIKVETLVFATSGILSVHEQLVTLQRERKLEITSYVIYVNKSDY